MGRFAAAVQRRPGLVRRLFTPAEAERPVASQAARFAAKEALAKALGCPPGLDWHDAEVVREADGRPTRLSRCSADDCALVFYDSSRGGTRRWCSMQRCGNRAKVRAHRARRAAA